MTRAGGDVGIRAGGSSRKRRLWGAGALAVLAALVAGAVPGIASVGASSSTINKYHQANLVSDIPGVARITDKHLVNPWGISAGPSSPLWVSDNGSNVSTLYQGGVNGSIPQIVPLTVNIPGGAPTGTVFNPTSDFVVHVGSQSAPANFIFDSESGRITAWSGAVSGTNAKTEFTSSTGVYKGLALASVGKANYLYAANFHDATIDVFNGKFAKVTLPGGFTDSRIPKGYAPFNVQLLGGQLYVSYAKQNAARHDDVPGPGFGFVDVFDTTGHLVHRLIAHGALNAPWGLALAPAGFGAFAGDLLVGNFGDGAIHAYDPSHANALKGQLKNEDGNPIVIDGLWALGFGNGTMGTPKSLLFTAGIAGEAHGLFGEITAAP
jgi:uncharacterized protein (TIGR03118 family)